MHQRVTNNLIKREAGWVFLTDTASAFLWGCLSPARRRRNVTTWSVGASLPEFPPVSLPQKSRRMGRDVEIAFHGAAISKLSKPEAVTMLTNFFRKMKDVFFN